MKKIILLCALLSGCAHIPAPETSSSAEHKQAHYECLKEARYIVQAQPNIQVDQGRGSFSSGFSRGAAAMSNRSGVKYDSALYRACMNSRGHSD